MERGADKFVTDEMLEAIEKQVTSALLERLPELKQFVVTPFVAKCFGGGSPADVWAVARSGTVVLFISLDSEQFGVGFLGDDLEVNDFHFYPTLEIAVPHFFGAMASNSALLTDAYTSPLRAQRGAAKRER